MTGETAVTHKSKIGLEILIPAVLILGGGTAVMIINSVWPGLIVCMLVMLFMISIYTGTYYKITDDRWLVIKCGPLHSSRINVDDIEEVKDSNELTNAPALSIDRLEIRYKGGRILISPKDKRKFIDDLRKLNSKILG